MEEKEEGRVRDPLEELPYLADPAPDGTPHWSSRVFATRRTNHALSVLSKLARGGVKGMALAPFRYRGSKRVRMEGVRGAVVSRTWAKAGDFAPPAGRATGSVALSQLLGEDVLLREKKIMNYGMVAVLHGSMKEVENWGWEKKRMEQWIHPPPQQFCRRREL